MFQQVNFLSAFEKCVTLELYEIGRSFMVAKRGVHPAVVGCIEVLERCTRAVAVIPDTLYVDKSNSHDSIGCHLRHGLEHVHCFLAGLEHGEIDYDARARDERLELSRAEMSDALTEAVNALAGLSEGQIDRSVRVRQLPAIGEAQIEVPSSAARELTFISSHMIHHLSMINLYCQQGGVELSPNIGLAFSTAAYRNVAVG